MGGELPHPSPGSAARLDKRVYSRVFEGIGARRSECLISPRNLLPVSGRTPFECRLQEHKTDWLIGADEFPACMGPENNERRQITFRIRGLLSLGIQITDDRPVF